MYRYSTGNFYPYSLRSDYGDNWPSTGVDVADEVAAEFIGVPPIGKVRGTGADGMPVWVDAPEPVLTYAQELSALNMAYTTDRLELCQVWLVAAVADGVNENTRKEDIESEIAELDNQHIIDVADLKTKYGVS